MYSKEQKGLEKQLKIEELSSKFEDLKNYYDCDKKVNEVEKKYEKQINELKINNYGRK